MDLEKDQKYFYIAREGLKAPLPEPWKPYKNSKGEIFFINLETHEQVYEHPCDNHYKLVFAQTKARDLNKMESPKEMFKGLSFNQNIIDVQRKKEKLQAEENFEQHQMINDSFSNHSVNNSTNQVPASHLKSIAEVGSFHHPTGDLKNILLAPREVPENNLEEDQRRIDEETTNKIRKYEKSKNQVDVKPSFFLDILKPTEYLKYFQMHLNEGND
jgi:hypothetical protein